MEHPPLVMQQQEPAQGPNELRSLLLPPPRITYTHDDTNSSVLFTRLVSCSRSTTLARQGETETRQRSNTFWGAVARAQHVYMNRYIHLPVQHQQAAAMRTPPGRD